MPDFKIFTESKADIKFIQDYLTEHFSVPPTESLYHPLNSWSGYKSNGSAIVQIRENFEKGNRTILILDADNSFTHRQTEVLSDFQGYNIPIDLFLFPNSSSNGTLEDLLCSVAVQRPILDCFEAYESCISGYEVPVVKSKVFAYLDALLPANSKKNDKNDLIQDKNRNYRNPTHWNLHHEYLHPLHNFLSQFFIQP